MKIFNIENDNEVVYIEFRDVELLNLYAYEEKPNISDEYEEFLKNPLYYIDEYSEFVRFSSSSTLEYLKSLSWLIDYKKIMKLSNDEIESLIKSTSDEIAQIKSQKSTSKEKSDSLAKIYFLERKILTLNNLLQYRKSQLEIEFPLVEDSDSFKLTCEESCYIVVNSLGLNRILIYRKDGQKIDDESSVSSEFIRTALCTMSDKGESASIQEVKRELSDNKKYLIVYYQYSKKIDNRQVGFQLRNLFNRRAQ